MNTLVRIHVVTYRRPELLKRALCSLIVQTHCDWKAEVLNDDPEDSRPLEIVRKLGDPRIFLSLPSIHRGATGNFNRAFRTKEEPFASILEDDNWWEPDFLATMIRALEEHSAVELACGNERIWHEEANGSWTPTGRTIWPETEGCSLFPLRAADKCGPAKICNSSLLFRTRRSGSWLIPENTPVDVSEHFRERYIPHPILLVHEPLVNYAETLDTARSQDPYIWATYQILLVGSIFAALPTCARPALSQELWAQTRRYQPRNATTLLWASLSVPQAASLWTFGTSREKILFFLGILRRPRSWRLLRRVIPLHSNAWEFLCRGTVAESLSKSDNADAPLLAGK